MSLPSGYRKLEYIQSSGTQYIDLGVKPNHGYAIEIKAKCSATSKQTFGGCDTSWKSNGFMLSVAGFEFGNNANTSLQNHGSEPITLKLSADGGYKNGTKTWDTSAIPAFQATANFTLCALNRSGTPQEYLSGNTYYCKIWDDSGTLIRDCIPCKSTSGVVGLWDDVNSVFYQNAGTGTFTSGPEVKGTNKTLIGGTGYDLKGGKTLIGGTAYAVKKGRTLIDGTGYDISLLSGTPISELPVGNTVKIAVNGTLRDFLIVHQGLPSYIYDNSCNGTWLLMKDIYENRVWQSGNINKYESSDIHTYLNNTFLNLFESNIKDAIKQVKLPYRKNGGSGGTTQQGANGLPCKIFLLSAPEVHYEHSYIDSGEGAALSYFASCRTNNADPTRVAYYNGSAALWWLRSPYTKGANPVRGVYSNGNCGGYYASYSNGIRPALVLPSNTLVSDDGTITI